MSYSNPEVCTCRCHDSGRNMRHIRACCHTCPYCGLNIKPLFSDDHVKLCAEKHNHVRIPQDQLRARRERRQRFDKDARRR